MKRVLVVDDEPDVAQIVVEAVQRELSGVTCETVTDFAQASQLIREKCPDVVVLDLMEGRQSSNLLGQNTWSDIWQSGFCPVVIYTGWEGDLTPPIPADHPFVKRIAKGGGSESAVVAAIRNFEPACSAIAGLRQEVESVIQQVLRDTAGKGVIPADAPGLLLHAGRRRLAAAMDSPASGTPAPLRSWEQYLLPPIGDSPLTADVLRKRGSPVDAADDYRLVLTPSCDMVRRRKPSSVLLAKCRAITALVGSAWTASLKPANRSESEQRLVKEVLSQSAWNGWLPLPEFPGHIPLLVANLKDLEVVPFESLCPEPPAEAEFNRIASVDSPFREQVSWAFLTTIARPGMPDRDLPAWATACFKRVDELQASGTKS